MSELIGLMFSKRVQGSAYSSGASGSQSITLQAGAGAGGLAIPAGAKKVTILRYGAYFTQGSGGAAADYKFTQAGGDPLAGSAFSNNTGPKLFDLGLGGIEFDISTNPVVFTVSTTGTPSGWNIWIVGFWS